MADTVVSGECPLWLGPARGHQSLSGSCTSPWELTQYFDIIGRVKPLRLPGKCGQQPIAFHNFVLAFESPQFI